MAYARPTTPEHKRVGRKVCTRCEVAKPYSEFWRRRTDRAWLQAHCKACEALRKANRSAVKKMEHYERHREKLLDSYRLRSYGVSREQYDEMVARQAGVCAICQQPETARNKRGEVRCLAVDHDHNTGRVRGLLCAACNCGVGYFRENADNLRSAIRYLEGGQ